MSNNVSAGTRPLIYSVSNGQIEIKPRLKFELIISIHVLKYAEDHHHLFIPWARQMRKDLSERTRQEATMLIDGSHEWQLCSLVQNYDGPDTIEALTDFIETDESKNIRSSAVARSIQITALSADPEKFPKWYADFLRRYYTEGFERGWVSEQRTLIYEDAKSISRELESLNFSPLAFMEEHTDRKFRGSQKIILYPSSFSRPQHAYGFNEMGHKVTVYKVGGGLKEVLGTVFHELLHPLIRDWWKQERMAEPIAKVAAQPVLKLNWEKKGKGSYPYPIYWLDELFVHAMGTYLEFKADMITEEQARWQSYGSYESAIYDAIFESYETFDQIDDFIFHALTHIEANNDKNASGFTYCSSKEK